MKPSPTVVLVGAGHSHVQVIQHLSSHDNAAVILLSDSLTAVYSGMLPAVISGIIPLSHAQLPLPEFCAAHNARFIHAKATRVIPTSNTLLFQPHATSLQCTLHYDYLSINVGSCTRSLPFSSVPSDTSNLKPPFVVYTRPIAALAPSIAQFETFFESAPTQPPNVLVVGAGAAGIELCLALHARLSSKCPVSITLVSRHEAFAQQFGRRASAAVRAELRRRGISHLVGRTVIGINTNPPMLRLHDSPSLPFDMVVVATGASPHPWMKHAGLPVDNYGWLLVEPSLQCVGLSNVFASGDCASFGNKYGLGFPPKAGVYAVRQGAVLAHNLDILLSSRAATQPLKPFVPQPCFLSLLSTGDGRGIGSKYGLVFTGTWVYRLKSYIDEMWQNRFRSSSNRTSSHVSRTGVVDSKFEGSPAEGAVVLLAAEDIFSNDSFEQQLMVLRRMDNDMHFRERLLACVEVS